MFTPDRLAVVKGGPAARRAYLDRTLARVFPSRSDVPLRYGAALGQRNAALRALAAGASAAESLAPWTEQVAEFGRELVAGPHGAAGAAAARLPGAARASSGLDEARLEYDGDAADAQRSSRLAWRAISTAARPVSARTCTTSGCSSGDRGPADLRLAGRAAAGVLSLLLCEAELLVERGAERPLLLLDDALSELDGERRRTPERAPRQRRPDGRHGDRAPRRCHSHRRSSSSSRTAA